MRARGWYRTTTETVAPGGTPGTVVRFWSGRWTEHVGPLPPAVEHSPVATQVIRIPATKGMPLMRYRILASAAVATVAALVVGSLALNGASAATPDYGPGTVKGALVRIDASSPRGLYIDANGVPHCLPSGPNATGGQDGDYPAMWFSRPMPKCDFGAGSVTPPVVRDDTPAVKRETNVTVNVDFDASKPITVTGLPAYRAGSPELWGDNTGSISDAAADIVVLRANTATTDCGTLDLAGRLSNVVRGNAPAASVIGDATVAGSARQVGSTVQKFCVYPRHISATTATGGSGPVVWSEGFLAGQSYKLNVWVYAP